ncbi:MAG: tRNA preQ1(34) S-adenosylmethionine ribosyltransferase-isomerase QueA [Alphaproteobacteria bacterium]|nr:tRNA preQ1(34) S-adenosylmethionine ribosyltransferase-isomerase QueA [Alphaproteobacteria bacterium]
MKIDIFDFELPKEAIANQPVYPRDTSKLLDLTSSDTIHDRKFYDLPDLLEEGDVLVFNDTKVIPARLYGARGEALVELTLYHPIDGIKWMAFIKNSKRLKNNDIIKFYTNQITPKNSDFSAIVIEKHGEDGVQISFNCPAHELASKLEQYGFMPLPPYIKRNRPSTDSMWYQFNDKENYQTIYAKHEGAVAAPTAGLHFTPEILKKLQQKGIIQTFVTLHVGAGTFLPVKTDDTNDHKMHAEYGIITQDTVDTINNAKQKGKRIIAVGTTSLRLLETATDNHGILHPFADETSIFITPGYKFKLIDMIITNFHLPKSTLFMLVCAIAGTEKMQKAYTHAIKNGYRFYSYGDSSIIKCVNKI